MKKISSRQVIIFYIICSFAIKFLMLPHYLAQDAGHDAWLVALIGSLFEILVLYVVITCLRINRNKELYETLSGSVTRVIAKCVLAVLFLFFALQTFVVVRQTSFMIGKTLYENLDFHVFVLPLLIFGVFICYMQTRAVFRSGEIFFALLVIALALALLPSGDKLRLDELLPIFDTSAGNLFVSVYKNLVYFEGGIFLLIYMGDIEIKKHFARNFLITASICALIFTVFVAGFLTIFGPLAPVKNLAIVNVTQVSSYISQNGRLEWIIACVWLMLLLLRFGVCFYAMFKLARDTLSVNRFVPGFVCFPLAVVVYIVSAFIIVSLTDLQELVVFVRPIVAVFYLLIPLFILLISIFARVKPAKRVPLTHARQIARQSGEEKGGDDV